ncbi:hypothetical protein TNCT_650111 [Trichonephila clavata]|uniref:DUF4371 domain-containing protein n=1 Tax=Trichonephila clavata TaxID=2740835 RepID=A0A8X6GHS6_TRICU|nr:hypothetical protein TNCT_650111 [Trichonephila clavata]
MIKEYVIAVAEEMGTEKVNLLRTVSKHCGSEGVRHRRKYTISSDKMEYSEWFSLALDESTDMSDTAQVLIFIRGINKGL